jgi:FkbM family methyltransferase
MKKILNKFLYLLDKQLEDQNVNIIKYYLGNNLKTVFDIGAHKGETIDTLKNNFKINKIYAFEPNPEIFNILKKRKFKNVKIFQLGVSNKKGIDTLKIGYISSMSTLSKINESDFYSKIKKIIISIFYGKFAIYKKNLSIRKIQLKKFLISKNIEIIDLLKIDTEGHELNVIKGLENKIKKVRLILFEHHYDKSIIKDYNYKDINRYLVKNNFVLASKLKMKFRKSYEMIYYNNKFNK